MTVGRRNVRWKLGAIGAAFAIGSALETGLVLAQWTAKHSDQEVVEVDQGRAALRAGGSQVAQADCAAGASTHSEPSCRRERQRARRAPPLGDEWSQGKSYTPGR